MGNRNEMKTKHRQPAVIFKRNSCSDKVTIWFFFLVIYCFRFGIYTNQPINYWIVHGNFKLNFFLRYNRLCVVLFHLTDIFFSIVRKHLNCLLQMQKRIKPIINRRDNAISCRHFHFHTKKPRWLSIRFELKFSAVEFCYWNSKKTDFCFLFDHRSVTTPMVRWIEQTFRNDCAQSENQRIR